MANPVIREQRTAKVWMRPDNILMVQIKPNAAITLDDAIENLELGEDMTEGLTCGLCIDMRHMRSIDGEARKRYSSSGNNADNTKALALIIGSPVTKMIANFFMGINKPVIPVKMFTEEKEAIAWLRSHLS